MQALNTGVADMLGSGTAGAAKGTAGGGQAVARRGGDDDTQPSGRAAPASGWERVWHGAVDGRPSGEAGMEAGAGSAAATLTPEGAPPPAATDPALAGTQPDALWLHASPVGWAADIEAALADPGGEELPLTGRLLPPGSLYAPSWLLAGRMSGHLANDPPALMAGTGPAPGSVSTPTAAGVEGDIRIALSVPGSERGMPATLEMPSAAQPVAAGQPARSMSDAIGMRLQWMAQHGHQQATLQLHPERLGTLDIRLRVEGDTAHLQLNAHAQARESLEQAAPRLREMLAELGLAGAQIDIQTRADHRNQPGEEPQPMAPGSASDDVPEDVAHAVAVVPDRLLDVYA